MSKSTRLSIFGDQHGPALAGPVLEPGAWNLEPGHRFGPAATFMGKCSGGVVVWGTFYLHVCTFCLFFPSQEETMGKKKRRVEVWSRDVDQQRATFHCFMGRREGMQRFRAVVLVTSMTEWMWRGHVLHQPLRTCPPSVPEDGGPGWDLLVHQLNKSSFDWNVGQTGTN